MKSRFYFLLIAIGSVVFLASCNKNNPEDVAYEWLTDFNQMEFEDAMKLSTNDTKNLLYSLEQLTGIVSDSERNELKNITVTIKNVKADSTTAVVTYVSSDNPNVQTVNLVKRDNKWLVLFTKVDLVGTIPSEYDEIDKAYAPADTEDSTDSGTQEED